MGKVLDHLRSAQFIDEDGNKTGGSRVALIVAPGRPRWLGYAFFLAVFITAAVLALGLIDLGGDMIQIIGVVAMLGAVLGALEVWRGRPLSLRRR